MVTSEARFKKREALGNAADEDAELDLRAYEPTNDITTFIVEDKDGFPQVWVDDRPNTNFRR